MILSFRFSSRIVSAVGIVAACFALSNAENIVYPPNTQGVQDITQAPYYADNTGQNDVTDILNQALEETRTVGNWAPRILYLPNGTYLVTGEVTFKLPPYTIGPHLQGQSKAGTVIKLQDSTWLSPSGIGYVLKTGGDVAQNFCRGVFNLTVNTGTGNAGAIGIKWYANNEALMSDVNIIDEDGRAAAGMQIGGIEQGPCIARRLYIRGFRFGVLARPSLNTTTLTEICLEGQTQYGVYHTGGLPLYIDSLYSNNTVPAVYNGIDAQLVLTSAHMVGGDPSGPAIINEQNAMLFAQNIQSEGYSKAIESTAGPTPSPSGNTVREFLSHEGTSLFGSPAVSLNLPVKRPPEIPWEQDMSKWANIDDYTSGRSDAQALQAAIDDASKTAVIIPMGRNYNLSGEVYLRGNIQRIIGVGAEFSGGSLVIPDAAGAPDPVMLQKITGTGQTNFRIINRSSRTVIMETIIHATRVVHEGTGDLYLVDDCTAPLTVSNPSAHVWAWDFNAEGGDNMLTVSAGTVWIFGWKDEGVGTSAYLTGGTTEILGFYNMHTDVVPQFVIEDASVSIAAARKGHYGEGYNIIVRDTKNGDTRELLATDNPVGYPTEFGVPLYTSYNADDVKRAENKKPIAAQATMQVYPVSGGKLKVSFTTDRDATVGIRLMDPSGRVVCQRNSSVTTDGAVQEEISVAAQGMYFLELAAEGRIHRRSVTIMR